MSTVSDTRDTCLAAEGTRAARYLKTVSEGLVFTAIHWTKRGDPDSRQTEIAATAALLPTQSDTTSHIKECSCMTTYWCTVGWKRHSVRHSGKWIQWRAEDV